MPTLDWSPTDKQREALERTEKEVAYGGARGGGKTEAGIVWPLYKVQEPHYAGLVIRKNSTDLVGWIERAKHIYSRTGATLAGNPPVFRWPNGARVETGHLKDENAYEKYQGNEYQDLIIEELTQIPREENYLKLISSCRSTIPGIRAQIFTTFNPGGPGHKWVKKRFGLYGIPKEPVITIDSETGLSRVFIPAKVFDNPHILKNDPDYLSMLNGLPNGLREAWRDGSWDSFEISGAYFTKELAQAVEEKRICNVPWEPSLPVHTWWDLGVDDYMVIGFFQFFGKELRIIDFYQNHGYGLNHYFKILQDKPYHYGSMNFPHDIEVREMTSNRTRKEILNDMWSGTNLSVSVVPKTEIEDGIVAIRTVFPKLYIDQTKCDDLIDAISQYRQDWDDTNGIFKNNSVHDWTSHPVDMIRYFAVSYHREIVPDREERMRTEERRERNKKSRFI